MNYWIKNTIKYKIYNFFHSRQEVTGVEDVGTAKSKLEQHGWSVESAVQMHLMMEHLIATASWRPPSLSELTPY